MGGGRGIRHRNSPRPGSLGPLRPCRAAGDTRGPGCGVGLCPLRPWRRQQPAEPAQPAGRRGAAARRVWQPPLRPADGRGRGRRPGERVAALRRPAPRAAPRRCHAMGGGAGRRARLADRLFRRPHRSGGRADRRRGPPGSRGRRGDGRRGLPWQDTRDAYRIWLSEIMLQQTQVATALPYFERFVARFPTLGALAAADEGEVLALWSGLGYYARARNLHRAARLVAERHGGEVPTASAELARLPGIGRSTAAAIAAFAAGERGAILHGNVKRVLARHAGVAGDPSASGVAARPWPIPEERLLPRVN